MRLPCDRWASRRCYRLEAVPNPYDSAYSDSALHVLTEHFDLGADLYKFWGSPRSVLRALLLGWARAGHPSHLHYAWDLEIAPSLDDAILETTRRALALLDLSGVDRPHLFEPGCGIGGGVTQVAAMLPQAKVTGLSLVDKQLEIGRAMARARGLKNTQFVQGNYLGTAFPDAFFDGIFAIETLVYTPIAEKPMLCRELFRILKPERTFVSFDGFRQRDPADDRERRWVQDVLDGWTTPLPPTPREFQEAARSAGFEVLRIEDATRHVYRSAQRISAIATCALLPLSQIARAPLLSALLRPLGFQSPRQARRFVEACRSQLKVFDAGLGAYYVHVFRKPAAAA
jgi:cyclopropane fatty-acyl-phospholipid synthase-like methyltransferase